MFKKSDYKLLLCFLLFCLFISTVGCIGSDAETSSVLKGGVAETEQQIIAAQNHALGFATTSGGAPAVKKVSAVFLGTPAWYQGLREGDQIVGQTTKQLAHGLQSTVTFARNGSTYQASLTSTGDFRRYLNASSDSKPAAKATGEHKPPEPAQPSPASADAVSAPTNGAPASTIQLSATSDAQVAPIAMLRNHDIAVLIDRSGSMGTTDCPQAGSRWQWCRQQALQFSSQLQADFPTGFTLVLFNNHQKVVTHADISAIDRAFCDNQPDGGTDTAGAVASQLRAHNSDKEQAGRALILIVITDGEPNDENALRKTLIAAANEATKSDDVSVVFLQVGEDNQATAFLEDLDLNLTQEGAKFHIVHTVTFGALKQQGLLRAIADALRQPKSP